MSRTLVLSVGTLFIALSMFAACSSKVQEQQNAADVKPDTSAGAYPLEPGDAIRLAFWREPELSSEYPVDETGAVVLPFLGHRNVTGIPPAMLKEQLLEEYGGQLQNQQVQVTLLRRVRVLGAVNEPGLYFVDPTMTLGDAIALAEGVASDGKLDDIKIFRDGEEIRSNLDSTVRVTEVRSGDQILVPQRSWFSRNGAIIVASMVSALAFILVAASF